jgi:hypothetical protein
MSVRAASLLCYALLLAISLASRLNAQTTTSGGLMGVVTDPSNAVVPDADVEIRDDAKGAILKTKTDQEGVYRFFFLVPSRYTLKVKREGFREETRGVHVFLGPPGTVNITLEISKESTRFHTPATAMAAPAFSRRSIDPRRGVEPLPFRMWM